MRKNLYRLLGLAFLLTFVSTQFAIGQVKDDLQAALDNIVQTKADEVTVVDLSQYSALERSRPLYVRGGVNLRFTNGTISRTTSLTDSATVVIQDGSSLDLGDKSVISGGGFIANHEVILVEDGNLKVSSGTIQDLRNESTYTTDRVFQPSDWGVLMLSSKCSFEMTGGLISGGNPIKNNGGRLTLSGGNITGWIETDVDIIIYGSFNGEDSFITLLGSSKMIIKSSLQYHLYIALEEYNPMFGQTTKVTDGRIIAEGSGYTVMNDDYLKMTLKGTSIYSLYFINNKVVVFSNNTILDATTLQQAIDKADNGTENNPTVITIPTGGITLNGPITIPTGKHILITGGPITVKSFTGDWVFKISADATLVFKNIILDGGNCSIKYFFYIIGKLSVDSTCTIRNTSGYTYFYYITKTGISFIHGGTVAGATYGIWNEGKAYVYDGTFNRCKWAIYNTATGYLVTWKVTFVECTYRIYSYTCFWTRGDIDHGDIWIYKTVTIYVFTKITHQWTIHYIDGELPGPDQTILSGSDDGAGSDPYKLGTGDVPPVFSDKWPGEKEPKFDTECGCYKPQTTTGTSTTVTTEAELQKAIENATGSCNGDPTTITINGTITIANGIVIKDKAIKLTGGKIIRSSTYLKDLISLQGACLTLENIDIDGNKDAFDNGSNVWSAIDAETASLTINDGTKIHNHRGYNGIIIFPQNCTFVINGGSIYDNYCERNIIASESPVVMNGGSIYNNLSIDNVFWTVSFTMNGGTIEKNLTKYYTLSINEGTIKHPAIVRNNSGGITFLTTLTIEGDGSNISDPVTFESATSYIIRNAKHTSPLTISHKTTIANQLLAGTVVVKGTDNYQLTKSDLGYYSYKTTGWTLSLSGNTIILGQGKEPIDDLIDKLKEIHDGDNKGTPKDPVDVPCGSLTLDYNKTIDIPSDIHIRIMNCVLTREKPVDGSTGSVRMIDIPETSSVAFDNSSIDGSGVQSQEPLILVKGTMSLDNASKVTGANDNSNAGGAVYVANTGTFNMNNGEISGNAGVNGSAIFNEGTLLYNGGTVKGNTGSIGSILNYDGSTFTMTGGTVTGNTATKEVGGIYIGENVKATFTGGTITSNGETSDIYTWSNINYSGAVNATKLKMIQPAKLFVTSKLKNKIQLDYMGDNLTAGTIVAQGSGYQLGSSDFSNISSTNKDWQFAFSNGNIILKLKDSPIEVVDATEDAAYMEGGQLILVGQTVGVPYTVYSLNGRMVKSGIIKSAKESIQFDEKGLFLIRCGKNSYKVVNIK
jgi:hypothetical protein